MNNEAHVRTGADGADVTENHSPVLSEREYLEHATGCRLDEAVKGVGRAVWKAPG